MLAVREPGSSQAKIDAVCTRAQDAGQVTVSFASESGSIVQVVGLDVVVEEAGLSCMRQGVL